MKKITLAIVLLFSVLASQAQSASTPNTTADKAPDEQESLAKTYLSQIMGVALSATSNMKLFHFVYDWIGTPYHFGGESRRGIDCSAFTKELYSEVFNLDIKRSSRDIFSMVNPVGRDDLKEGDLVFFSFGKTGIVNHVGIYLHNNKFVHASTSKGVIISNLTEPYYGDYLVKCGSYKN